jgi:ArsR family transcriptional regulator
MELDLREKAALLRVLGHPVRLAILIELSSGPKCVTDMQGLLDVQQANVSQHLGALRHERIVDYHEDGKLRCYYLARPGLAKSLLKFIGGDYPVVPRSKEAVRRAGHKRACAVKAAPGKACST